VGLRLDPGPANCPGFGTASERALCHARKLGLSDALYDMYRSWHFPTFVSQGLDDPGEDGHGIAEH